ncbi:sensor domain-containing protein [Streptomyces sp. NPDC048845]|uniref:sensor domain-containing protein n=1 Tax=Streptomyces sp. NPDC048845 TaxID=3155390 RepID=UPI00344235B3
MNRGRLRRVLIGPFAPRSLGALLFAVLSAPLALAGAVLLLGGLLVGAALSVTPLGPWLLALVLRGAVGLGALHRGLLKGLLGVRVEPPVVRRRRGAFGWRRAALGDPAGWRATGCLLLAPLTALLGLVTATLAYAYGLLFLLYPVLRTVNNTTVAGPDGRPRHVGFSFAGVEFDVWPLQIVLVAAGIQLLLSTPWLMRQALLPHRTLLGALLGPSAEQRRIRTLEQTRSQAVEDAVATLRRIERDLHDGTQARLVGLGMHLTMIRELLSAGAERERVLAVVDTARDNARQAVADLRDLVRGIHPPVLDQGLDTALETLAAGCALPVTVHAKLGGRRASPAIESIAYFCAAELLANAVKHSGASAVTVDVRRTDAATDTAPTPATGPYGPAAAAAPAAAAGAAAGAGPESGPGTAPESAATAKSGAAPNAAPDAATNTAPESVADAARDAGTNAVTPEAMARSTDPASAPEADGGRPGGDGSRGGSRDGSRDGNREGSRDGNRGSDRHPARHHACRPARSAARARGAAAQAVLRLTVSDNGRGGARPGAGTGLTGLLDRVGTVDGTLVTDSPPGGPTVVTVTLPC